MYKSLFILSFSLLYHGCHQRTCLEKDAYNGLYNALTCNYQERIERLEDNITKNKLEKNQEQKAYEILLNEVEKKEQESAYYKISIEELDFLIYDINNTLNNTPTDKAIAPLLYKIRKRVLYLKKKHKFKKKQ